MASRPLRPEQIKASLDKPGSALAALYIITGDEHLLVMEMADALRAAARRAGYTERTTLIMDARSDWQTMAADAGSGSLFGERRLLEIRLPSGKPGKTGGEVLSRIAQQAEGARDTDTLTMIILPRPDRALRGSAWFGALSRHGVVIDVLNVERNALPEWIGVRLSQQGQQAEPAALQWMADRVEGNLLAAHQEIMKLGLSYPAGRLSLEDIQEAVMNVARYNAFKLRDAIQSGNAPRVVRMIEGLRAEGEALPLVLWAVTQVWGRSFESASPAAIRHAHDIDRLIKGLPVAGRLPDPWQELTNLALRLTRHETPL